MGRRCMARMLQALFESGGGVCVAGVETSEALEERFLAHVPGDQIGDVAVPTDFVGSALLGRRDSAPGPDGLRYAAWAAVGPEFENAFGAYMGRVWAGEGLSSSDRVALTCVLPKDCLVDGVMKGTASRPISLMNTSYRVIASSANQCLASALPAYIHERQKGFMRERLGIDHLIVLELFALLGPPWGPDGKLWFS